MTTDLETRLEEMGGALHRTVSYVPDRRHPPSGRTRVAVGVPLVALAALATTLVVRSDEPANVASDPIVNLRGLIPDEAPEGLELSWAGQQAAQATATPEEVAGVAGGVGDASAGPIDLHTYLYGDASTSYPFGTGDLVVNVWETAAGATGFDAAGGAADLPGAIVTTVQGQEAVLCDVATCALGTDPVSSVQWQTTEGIQTIAASQSLDADQILEIAEGLVIDGTDVSLGDLPSSDLGALPSSIGTELTEVARLHDTVVGGARDLEAFWVGYADRDDPTRALDVTTLTGGADELTALLWSLRAAEKIDVRGTQAFLSVGASGDDPVELVWQEANGVLAHVTALGMSQDEVVDFVEGLRWVADGEWPDVEELAEAAQAALPPTPTVAPELGDGEAGVSVDSGEGPVDADAQVSADADGIDVGVQAETAIADLEASLHTDLGAAAVLGPVVSGLADGVGAIGELGSQVVDQVTPPPGSTPDLVP